MILCGEYPFGSAQIDSALLGFPVNLRVDFIQSSYYGNPNWKDQLTAVNGTVITYDQIGNPLNEGTWTYTWQNGRQLASMTNGETTASFVYNENGLRVQKTVNGVVTDYTLHGKNVVHMTQGNDELHFFYDAQNKPAIVVFNGVPYSYVKNLQGDIVAILNNAGTAVVNYVYDAWGRPISKTGSLASTLGTVQPFRYRGYVYDEGTGLYYLKSRYYSFEWLRFVNADALLRPNFNSFCYCMQQPINRVDPNGTDFFETCWDEMSNRSLLSPMHLGAAAPAYKGNTSGVWDPNGTWARTQNYNEDFINSDNNTGYQTPAHKSQNSTLYRSVSEGEAADIETTGRFNLLEGQMESKQFALDESEAWTFGAVVGNSTIVSVEIGTDCLLNNLDVNFGIDPFIFKHGVVTVQDHQMEEFNNWIYRETIRFKRK